MKKNLLISLKEKYPELLEELDTIEHQEGWYKLLDELLEKIEAYLMDYPKTEKVKFVQIKEKFGGLRAYCYGGDDLTHRMIIEAEKNSRTICELCGSSLAKIRTLNNWYMCRCDICWKEQK